MTQAASEQQGDFYAIHYGCAGDGAHDDAAAIKAAISACIAGGGSRVLCPPSTTMVGTTLTLVAGVELVIPMNGILMATVGLVGPLISATGIGNLQFSGGGILDGNRANSAGNATDLIALTSCPHPQVHNLVIRNAYRDGISLTSSDRAVLDTVETMACGRHGTYLNNSNFLNGMLMTRDNGARIAGSGLVFDGTSSNNAVAPISAFDTRVGGARTQLYGIQEAGGMTGTNNTWASFALSNNVTAASSIVGAGSGPQIASGSTITSAVFAGTQTTAAGSGAGAGTDFTLTPGQGGATGVGGQVLLTAGAGGATSGAGGLASLAGGNATAGNSGGGVAQLNAGNGSGSGSGAVASINGGNGGTTGAGGGVQLGGGNSGGGNNAGGVAQIISGASTGTSPGPQALVQGGPGGTSAGGSGGPGTLAGGAAGAASGGNGGRVQLLSGAKDGAGLKPLPELDASGDVPTTAVMALGMVGFRMNGSVLSVFANVGSSIKTFVIGTLA